MYELLVQIHGLRVWVLKGALSGLRQFLAIESPLKMTKNAFYFISKAQKLFSFPRYLKENFTLIIFFFIWP